MGLKTPLIHEFQVPIANVAAASDLTSIIGRAPFDGVVEEVKYIPKSAITGQDTETRTLAVVNKGAAGSGSTSVASLALANGVNASALVGKAITLSGTAANKNVTAGDVLVFTSTHAGSTGLADPGGMLVVKISRSNP